MYEQLLDHNTVWKQVQQSRADSRLNQQHDLSAIVAAEDPHQWQALADELVGPIQTYIKETFDVDLDVTPGVPSTDVLFSCLRSNPFKLWDPTKRMRGARMDPFMWATAYLLAAYRDVSHLRHTFSNRDEISDRTTYFPTISEIHKARLAGGPEMIDIQAADDYHEFVYTVAHEIGHSLARVLHIEPSHEEMFALTFGLSFMEWYVQSAFLSPPAN